MHDTTELPELTDSMLGRPGMSTADRSRWMALVVLCTGMLMIVLDSKSAIVNASLMRHPRSLRTLLLTREQVDSRPARAGEVSRADVDVATGERLQSRQGSVCPVHTLCQARDARASARRCRLRCRQLAS